MPAAVLNVAYGNNGDYGSMPCSDEVYRAPYKWLEANARRFHFTDARIIAEAVTEFHAPNLPPMARCYGVYFLINGCDIVYIGQSTDIPGRILTHRKNGVDFDRFTWFEAPELYLRAIEAYYIRRIQPPLNWDWPKDSQYSEHAEKFDPEPPKPRKERVIYVRPLR